MTKTWYIPAGATTAIVVFSVLAASNADGQFASISAALQVAVAVSALVWTAYQSYQQQRASDRSNFLQTFSLAQPHLAALAKEIALNHRTLNEETKKKYELNFNGGDRTAYVKLLTAKDGRVLRSFAQSKNAGAEMKGRLERRLKLYEAYFEQLKDLLVAANDKEMLKVLMYTAEARTYLAVKAALAPTDSQAEAYHDQLKVSELETSTEE